MNGGGVVTELLMSGQAGDRQRLLRWRTGFTVFIGPAIKSRDEKLLSEVETIIANNLSDSAFTVVRLAEMVNLSRSQLYRRLKAFSGVSPVTLINDMRMAMAAELIQANADTISRISYMVGYNEQSYFTRCFRRKFGVPPSRYGSTSLK